jgi:hypothetical protein
MEEFHVARIRSLGLLVSATAAATLLLTPVAFADGGHRERNRGGDGDEDRVVVNTNAPAVQDLDDDDVNEDRGELQATPARPQVDVEVDHEINDLNGDND